MEYVKVPMNVMVKASRYNRELHKYLRYHLAGVDPEKQELEREKLRAKEAEIPKRFYVDNDLKIKPDHSGELPEGEFKFRGNERECELYLKQPSKEDGSNVEPTSEDEPTLYEVNGKSVDEEELRAMAKEAGVKNWHIKKPENIIDELSKEDIL